MKAKFFLEGTIFKTKQNKTKQPIAITPGSQPGYSPKAQYRHDQQSSMSLCVRHPWAQDAPSREEETRRAAEERGDIRDVGTEGTRLPGTLPS